MASAEFVPLEQAHPPFCGQVSAEPTLRSAWSDWGRPLSHRSIPTNAEQGAEEGARRMGEATRLVIADASLTPQRIARAGLGTPGTMDIPSGMLLEPVNIKSWRNFPIRDRVAYYTTACRSFANDAKAAAYGEFWVGRAWLPNWCC